MSNVRQRMEEYLDQGGFGGVKPEHREGMLDILEMFGNIVREDWDSWSEYLKGV
ncbi:gp20 [Mycobacterium phage Omega]|uniref:Uncharacterized protein n=1 Tax=Mycobacterium phage Omega TaxID=2907835 RepID=Q854P4_BPMOM|nr:gp20 [Mycobacterium phage Omega]AAN12664.1 hypothetical protein PBI_OMEGA_20 [Mycobacterium phage Omega]